MTQVNAIGARRLGWQGLIVLLAVVCHPDPPLSIPAIAASRPNIVLIIADDQGYGDLGVHGNPHVRTPVLDRLAADSIRFDRFFVSPLCAPTRASLLTGRYSLRTGVRGVSQGLETMRAEEVTFAEALRDAGYRTGYFGKWHNGEHYPFTPQGQGFGEAFGFNLGHWNNYFDTPLERNGRSVRTSGYISDVLTDAAIGFIAKHKAEPFLCYLAYNVPHSPFQVPNRYFDRYKAKGLDDYLASVYGMVENMDDNIGRVLDRLDQLKLRGNTIVIFLSDNGPNGERFSAGMRGAKGTWHEGGSRVPFFLRWPDRFHKPAIVPNIAAHIDLFATLLELAGVPMPKTLPQDGRSLVPLLNGRGTEWPDRMLFTQHVVPPNNRRTGAVRTQRYRLVGDGKDWQLFDMETDPAQSRDVSAAQPDVAKRLADAYAQWWSEVLPDAERPRPPIPVGYAEDPDVELPAPQARFQGLQFSGKHPNNAWLTGWTDPASTAEWEIDVVRAAPFEIALQYLSPAAAGARVRVAAAGSVVEAIVERTPYRQRPSPDRVARTEVYEMEWRTRVIGTLHLPAGRTTVSVRAMAKPGEPAIDLKAVTLRMRRAATSPP